MNLADKPCYPTSFDEDDGLTFKERLIIALASNPAICGYDDMTYDMNGEAVVKQADAIIKQLEKQ